MVSLTEEERRSVIEDKRKSKAQKADTRRNPKRHMSPVSLILWQKMVAVRCFVWPLALRLWSGWLAGWLAGKLAGRRNIRNLAIFKIRYLACCKHFLDLNGSFIVRWTITIP